MDRYGAIILAGGKSRRMGGQDKAFLPFGNEILLEKIYAAVESEFEQTVIVLSQTQKQPQLNPREPGKLFYTRDSVADIGPLQGIRDGLIKLSPSCNKVFLLTCDIPYISSGWINQLKKAFVKEMDAVVCVQDGYSNALLALYQRWVPEQAEDLLASGEIKAKSILRAAKVVPLETESTLAIPSADEDMDNPEGYRQALEYFGFFSASEPDVLIRFIWRDEEKNIILPIRAATLSQALQVSKTVCPVLEETLNDPNQRQTLIHQGIQKSPDTNFPRLSGDELELVFETC